MGEPKAKDLYPFGVFLANDGETWLVSTYTLPQHPVCSCGPNKAYAEMICNALSLVALAERQSQPAADLRYTPNG